MWNKLAKRLKLNPRTNNGNLSNVVHGFLKEMKASAATDASFSSEESKQLQLNLLILGEGKGAANKWLFYNSDSHMTSKEDIKAIAELCFGNFRLETQANASKVHPYKLKGKQSNPPSGILLSRVCKFTEDRSKSTRCRNDTSQSSENDEGGDRSSTGLPVGSPGRNEGGSNSSRSSAYFSSTESIFSQSPGRAGSLPRETFPWLVNSVSRKSRVDISHRSSMDTFCLTQFMEVLDADTSNDRRSTESRKSRGSNRQNRRGGCDLGFAILFQAEDADFARRFGAFFFANFGCIESRMVAMCDALARVVEGNTTSRCTSLCDEGFEKFRTEIQDLVFAPRLQRPIWLALSSETGTAHPWLYDVFLHNCLLVAIEHFNSKQFVTSLVTAILCNHLAWISTVEPVGSLTSAHSSHALTKQSPVWQEHTPYNPHCAQITDLYGLLGYPARLSRTLVVGKDVEVVEFFLFLTSYFLRCSKVARQFEELPKCLHPQSLELLYNNTQTSNCKSKNATGSSISDYFKSHTSTPNRRENVSESNTTSDGPKTSIDSGMASTEDIQASIVRMNQSVSEESFNESEIRSLSETLLSSPNDVTLLPKDVDNCGSTTARQMVCQIKYFDSRKMPYLDIPLLYGELGPRVRNSEDDSRDSQEWDEDISTITYSEGHSLLAGVHSHSTSFFALQGCLDPHFSDSIPEQLQDLLCNNGVKEDAEEAVCILVDTDRLTVSEYRLGRGEVKPRQTTPQPAKCVGMMLNQVASLAKLQLSSDLCLRYLEDQLQGIYMNALALAQVERPYPHIKALGYDKSDIPLLEAISSVHEPAVT